MKHTFFMLLLVTGSLLAKAQSAATAAAGVNEVNAVVDRLRTAMLTGNKEELESVLADDLTYGHSGGKIENKADFVDAITTRKSDFKTITFSKQTVTVQEDIAIVRHLLTADTNDGGKPAHINLGIVLVLRKTGQDWKLIARRAFHVAD